jgi:hypothetical protein
MLKLCRPFCLPLYGRLADLELTSVMKHAFHGMHVDWTMQHGMGCFNHPSSQASIVELMCAIAAWKLLPGKERKNLDSLVIRELWLI